MPGGLARGRDRRNEEIGTEQVLVVDVAHGRVVLVVEDQWSLDGRAGFGGMQECAVEIGHQAIAQPDRGAHELLDNLAP